MDSLFQVFEGIVDYIPLYNIVLSCVLVIVITISVLVLLITGYLVWVRRQYSHLPSPPMNRLEYYYNYTIITYKYGSEKTRLMNSNVKLKNRPL